MVATATILALAGATLSIGSFMGGRGTEARAQQERTGGRAASAAAPGTPAPGAPAQVEPGLLMHWGLNIGAVDGNIVTDGTGRAKAAVQGMPRLGMIGPGTGYIFNGKDEHLVLAEDHNQSKALLPTRELTAIGWFSITEPTSYGSLIGAIQDNGNFEKGWLFGYNNKSFYLGLSTTGADDGDGKMTYLEGKTQLMPGRWYHVAATYDGSAMRVYINGALETESKAQSGDILYPDKASYVIGAYKDTDEFFPLNGAIGELKLYNKVLSAAEIKSQFEPQKALTSYVPPRETELRALLEAPYLQAPTPTSMTVMWETSLPARAHVEYGTTAGLGKKTEPGSEATMHEIVVSGLEPHTSYFYKVVATGGDGKTIESATYQLQTAVRPNDAYAFTVIGDTQRNPAVTGKLAKLAYALRPNFQVHCGDVVDDGPDKKQWLGDLLGPQSQLLARVPMMPVIGNHERNDSLYYQYFSLPNPEYYYTFTYGNAQFFMVDTNKKTDPESEQHKWLERDLAASTATWKIAMHHHPIWSSDENDYGDTYKGPSTHGEMKHRSLASLYEKYGVDVVFTGHIHVYERTWPLREGKIDRKNGVLYITSGGGGGGLEAMTPTRTWFNVHFAPVHHICYVTVHENYMQLKAYDQNGLLFDTFELEK
ncbi:MAG: LamG-like jellyroll fold domain-containing protein [Planctomycetota bacterium]|nr:LamG-like jellyroll fold domain-containing protein [Planctomycetota bacterium]